MSSKLESAYVDCTIAFTEDESGVEIVVQTDNGAKITSPAGAQIILDAVVDMLTQYYGVVAEQLAIAPKDDLN